MVNTKEFVEKIVEEKLKERVNLIEEKLRNSFKLVKQDNLEIKEKLNELKGIFSKTNFNERIDSIKKEVDKNINLINEKINQNEEKVSSLEKEISKQNIKREIERSLFSVLNKKIEVNYSKQKAVLEKQVRDIESEIKMMRNAFREEMDSKERNFLYLREELNKRLEELSFKISTLKDELLNFFEKKFDEEKNSINKRFDEEKENFDKKIASINGRIGNLNKNLKNKEVSEKNKKEKKNIFSKIVDSLAD